MITKVLNWIRANMVTSICMALIVLSVASYYWPTYRGSVAFRNQLTAAQQQLNNIQNYFRQTAEVPAETADEPPRRVQMVINDAAIRKLEKIYDDLNKEYNDIYQVAIEHNRASHVVLAKGLFPTPLDVSRPYRARQEYLLAFEQMYQSLEAGTPPSEQTIQAMMQRKETQLRQKLFLGSNESLNARQQRALMEAQRQELEEMFKKAAAQHHLYAQPVVLQLRGSDARWEPGPFQVGEWAQPNRGRPSMMNLWEAQMQLWIQQDLVRAISIANRLDDTNAKLIDMPVKQLLEILVLPGYVGIDEREAMARDRTSVNDPVTSQRPEQRLVDDYRVSPTGRHSNAIYDVRHAVLRVVVDYQQLPVLLNAIGQVDFMTIIGIDVVDVDEYAAFREGYYYGENIDAIRVDLTIESIWLREWTAGHDSPDVAAARKEKFNPGLMPDSVRYLLGLKPRNPDFDPTTDRTPTGRTR